MLIKAILMALQGLLLSIVLTLSPRVSAALEPEALNGQDVIVYVTVSDKLISGTTHVSLEASSARAYASTALNFIGNKRLEFIFLEPKSVESDMSAELAAELKSRLHPGDSVTQLIIATHGSYNQWSHVGTLSHLGTFSAHGISKNLSSALSPLKGRMANNAAVLFDSCSTVCPRPELAALEAKQIMKAIGLSTGTFFGASTNVVIPPEVLEKMTESERRALTQDGMTRLAKKNIERLVYGVAALSFVPPVLNMLLHTNLPVVTDMLNPIGLLIDGAVTVGVGSYYWRYAYPDYNRKPFIEKFRAVELAKQAMENEKFNKGFLVTFDQYEVTSTHELQLSMTTLPMILNPTPISMPAFEPETFVETRASLKAFSERYGFQKMLNSSAHDQEILKKILSNTQYFISMIDAGHIDHLMEDIKEDRPAPYEDHKARAAFGRLIQLVVELALERPNNPNALKLYDQLFATYRLEAIAGSIRMDWARTEFIRRLDVHAADETTLRTATIFAVLDEKYNGLEKTLSIDPVMRRLCIRGLSQFASEGSLPILAEFLKRERTLNVSRDAFLQLIAQPKLLDEVVKAGVIDALYISDWTKEDINEVILNARKVSDEYALRVMKLLIFKNDREFLITLGSIKSGLFEGGWYPKLKAVGKQAGRAVTEQRRMKILTCSDLLTFK